MPPSPVVGRASVIRSAHARSVPGEDLEAGMVLPSGVILQASLDHEARDVRLEMPGATVHYVEFGERVTVLATVSDDLLDLIGIGTFAARGPHGRPITQITTSQEG